MKDCFGLHGHSALGSVAKEKSGVGQPPVVSLRSTIISSPTLLIKAYGLFLLAARHSEQAPSALARCVSFPSVVCAALSAEALSVLGSKTKITGSNLFMRRNYWVVFCDGDILTAPPTLTGLDDPADATLALSSTAFTLTLVSIPSVTTNIKLIICASAPQSNGISRAYSKAAEFIEPKTPVTTAIALKTEYDDKYGAPSAGAPKVFVKYFYINTATGEKSGEKLASVVLSSSTED